MALSPRERIGSAIVRVARDLDADAIDSYDAAAALDGELSVAARLAPDDREIAEMSLYVSALVEAMHSNTLSLEESTSAHSKFERLLPNLRAGRFQVPQD